MAYAFEAMSPDEILGKPPAAPTAVPAAPPAPTSAPKFAFEAMSPDEILGTKRSPEEELAKSAALFEASFGKPTEEAKKKKLSESIQRMTGAYIAPNIMDVKDAERQFRLAEADHVTRASPRTSAFLSNTENAKIAMDDAKVLSDIEAKVNMVWGPLRDGSNEADEQIGLPRAKTLAKAVLASIGGAMQATNASAYLFRKLMAPGAASTAEGLAGVLQHMTEPFSGTSENARKLGVINPIKYVSDWAAGAAADADALNKLLLGDQSKTGFWERNVLSAAQSVMQSAMSLPAGLAVVPVKAAGAVPMALDAFYSALAFALPGGLVQGGQSYSESRRAGASVFASSARGLSDTATETGFEMIPGSTFLKASKGGTENFAKAFLKAQIPEVLTEIPTTLTQNFTEWAVLGRNKGKTWSDFVDEQPAAVLDTIVTTLMAGGGQVALGAVADASQRKQSQDFGTSLIEMAARVAESETRRIHPPTFDAFFQDVTEGATVFIDPDKLTEALAESKLDLATVLPTAAAAIANREYVGTGIEIPVSELISGLAGTGLEQAVIEHVRKDPDAMTIAEANKPIDDQMALYQEAVEKALKTGERSAEFNTQIQQIQDDVATGLDAIGAYSPTANKTQAKAIGAFYAVLADKVGVTPLQLRDGWTDAEGRQHKGIRFSIGGAAVAPQTSALSQEFNHGNAMLNIGLDVGAMARDQQVPLDAVRAAIEKTGAKVLSGEVVTSEYQHEGKLVTEKTYVPHLDRPLTDAEMLQLAIDTQQEAIPQYQNGTGKLHGPNAAAWGDFNPEFFKGQKGTALSDAQAELAQQKGKKKKAPKAITPGTEAALIEAASIENANKIADTGKFDYIRDLKEQIQNAVREAAQGADLSATSAEVRKYLTDLGTQEALAAMQSNANAIGWYDIKTRQALSVVALVHPEILTDPDARFTFIYALAVTSNGQKVLKNFELAERAYAGWKASGGTMPSHVGAGGPAGKKVHEALARYNDLVKKFGSPAAVEEFMLTEFTAKELAAEGFGNAGENVDTVVLGAAILGPKIGNGFFANLNGIFHRLTMDRWLMRTWGRWTGTLLQDNQAAVAAEAKVLKALVRAVRADKEANAVMRQVFAMVAQGKRAGEVDKALLTAKASPWEALVKSGDIGHIADQLSVRSAYSVVRAVMSSTPLLDELRRSGNRMANKLDGSNEAPGGGNQRNWIRAVFGDILRNVVDSTGTPMEMADLQALLWYPEKRLYDSAKADAALEGYEDDEAPDYANAAAVLARSKGIGEDAISAALANPADRPATVRPVVSGAVARELGSFDDEAGQPDGAQEELYQNSPAVRAGAVSGPVVGVHYSKESRTALSSAAFGTGLKGAEQERVAASTDPRIKQRIAFYVNTGTGIKPESGVGSHAHTATLTNLYDADADVLKLWRNNRGDLNAAESAVLDAGFDGYLKRDGLGAAVLLGRRSQAVQPLAPDAKRDAAYSAIFEATDAGPFDGGCVVTAQAIQKQIGGTLVALTKDDVAQHAAVLLDDRIYDFNGGTTEAGILARFSADEGASVDAVRPLRDADLPDAPRSAKDAVKVSKLLPDMLAAGPYVVDEISAPEVPTPQIPAMKAAAIELATNKSLISGRQTAAEWKRDLTRIDPEMAAKVEWEKLDQEKLFYRQDLADTLWQGSSELFAGQQDVRRGSFSPATMDLRLLADANLSTFLHEASHWFLAAYTQVASEPGAPQALVDEVNALLAHLGAGDLAAWNSMSLDQQRPYHEAWAESGEQYFMTGKAPSLALDSVFRTFANWLKRIYGSLKEFVAQHSGVPQAGGDLAQQVGAAAPPKPTWWDSPSANAFAKGMTQGEVTQDALDRAVANGSLEKVGDKYVFYHATPRKGAEGIAALHAGSLLERSADDAKFFARRDRGLSAAQVVVARLELLPWQVEPGVFFSLRAPEPVVFYAGGKGSGAGVKLHPTTAAFFDRMLATEAEIQQANEARGYVQLFKDAAEAGMTENQWAAYQAMGDDQREDAEAMLRARSLRDMKWLQNTRTKIIGAMQKEAEVQRKAVREQIATELAATPLRLAVKWLKKGEMTQADGTELKVAEGYKMSKDGIDEIFPEGALTPRPDLSALRGMTAKEGLHPDLVAEMFGFRSGEALVRDLLEMKPFKEEVEELTDLRMLQDHSELIDPAAIERAADEAIHNDARTRMVATELAALAKGIGSPAALMKAAKEYARQLVETKTSKTLKPWSFAAAETRAGKAALTALRKGERDEAAQQKRLELLNHVATKQAYAAEAEVKKIIDRFKRIAGYKDSDSAFKTRDAELVNAVRAILADFGIGAKGKSAREYLAVVAQHNPDLAAVLSDTIDSVAENAKDWRELKISEVRDLAEEIEGLWFLAKRSKQIEIDGKIITLHEAQQAIYDRLDELGIPNRVPGEGSAVTAAEKRGIMFDRFVGALRRVESWVGAKDGALTGPFRTYMWNPIRDAADAYRADKARYLKAYRDLLAPIAPSLTRRLIDAPEIGYVFGKDEGGMGKIELLHAILHTGNESNKRKLLLGRNWATKLEDGTLDTSKWDAFLQRMHNEGVLTKADYDFAQGVWDLLEGMKPMAQKAHRYVFGKYFAEVTANAFTNQFGTYAGGYVPAMTDPLIVRDQDLNKMREAEEGNMAYAFPTTAKGFTKSRVEYNRPLKLDLRTLSTHIDKVLLFSHMTRPTNDVRRVMSGKSVAQALGRVDPQAYNTLLLPWLNRAAKQVVETQTPGREGLGRFWSVVRARAGMAAMFANVANSVQQITGLFLAAVRVRPGLLMDAMVKAAISPRETAAYVAGKSKFMATRLENEVSQMSSEINEILLNPSVYESAKEWTRKHAYFMQSAVDSVIGPVVWLGGYNQAIEAGMSELDAVRAGDSAVRETQGSQAPEDIAAFETGSAFYRMFTQFVGYFNMNANLLGTEFVKLSRDMGLKKGAGRGLYVLTLGLLAPAIVGELIMQLFKGGPDDDDKDGEYLDDWLTAVLGYGLLRYTTAFVPGFGPAINATVNTLNNKPYDDRISTAPAISMVESAVKAPIDLYKAIVEDGKPSMAIKEVATLISMTVGVPGSALAKPVSYLADVTAGRVAPTSAGDAIRGTITGAASPASKQ